jgi:hypothetical protein
MHTRSIALAILGVGALYVTIWTHELAHSAMAYLWGCKVNWWQTDVSWYLLGSQAGKIDWDCLGVQGGLALGLTGFAGVAVNLIVLGLAELFLRHSWAPGNRWLFVGVVFWALANFAEAFSYLVLNTLWLKSDMAVVVHESLVNHWVWFAAGLVSAIVFARGLLPAVHSAADLMMTPRVSSRTWVWAFINYALVVGLGMGVARIMLVK